MWSGSTNNIPSGWALCNGSNGTPDLRGRFIVGAGSTYNVGATGGSNSVTLTTAQIPSHTHNFLAWSGSSYGARVDILKANVSSNGQVEIANGQYSRDTSSDMISSTGSGASHENRPPYYALCYIMKLSN